jgi:hypothetical protein
MMNSYGATGVTFDAPRDRWRAQVRIRVDKGAGRFSTTVKTIGRFKTMAEAQEAYRRYCEENRSVLARGDWR